MSKRNKFVRKNYGYVYIIGFKNGSVKVGKTSNIRQRLATHHAAYSKSAEIIKVWHSIPHWNYSKNESLLIKKLNEFAFEDRFTEINYYDVTSLIEFAQNLEFTVESEADYEDRLAEHEIHVWRVKKTMVDKLPYLLPSVEPSSRTLQKQSLSYTDIEATFKAIFQMATFYGEPKKQALQIANDKIEDLYGISLIRMLEIDLNELYPTI